MFHSKAINNKISRIYERALRLLYSDYSSNFDELLKKDDRNIYDRNIHTLAIEICNFFSCSFSKYNEKHFSSSYK